MRILAVGAHPDDIDALAGGTLIRLAKRGHQISYLICTDGSKGTLNHDEIPGMQLTRQHEQHDAARVVGADQVFFLNHVDGELAPGVPLRRDIVRVMRTVQPDLVFTWDPTSYWIGDRVINHADHRIAGTEALHAASFAGHRTLYPEIGLPPCAVRELWLFGTNHPTVFVDMEEELAQKIDAVRSHVSQHYADDQNLYGQIRDDYRWVVRRFQNPVTQHHKTQPECVETFRRVAMDPIPDLIQAIHPAWEDPIDFEEE